MATRARKTPQQSRAKETVRAILEATAQILDRESLDAATTKRIAEVAGVSVGSLYQYFSHRDAILEALQDREFERTLQVMQTIFGDGNLDKAPVETVTAVLRSLAQLYAQSPGLHRVLTIEGLRVAKSERVHAFDRRVIELVRYFLSATRAPLCITDVEAAAFIIYQSVRATMLAHLLERPHGLDVDRLIEELTRLITGYVLGGGEPATVVATASALSRRVPTGVSGANDGSERVSRRTRRR
jgi:AcrR family transcriptional regulator